MPILKVLSSIYLGFSFIDLHSETLENTDYFELSLQQLSDIEITSAAKKPQKLSMTASSIYILNQEDIKRSGATTIADALRLVPGVQVAKLDANKWAISIRGFNDIFSNKLLVLMDGRTVYSPFFGGAYWDTVDTILEDIDRIEVVRGPGGTLWGANAVNGVINIITKNTQQNKGLLVSALVGNEERGQISVRYGGDINDTTHYRIFAKGFEKDEAKQGVDDWRMGRLGFKINSDPDQNNQLTLQGEVYTGEEGEKAISRISTPPFGTFASTTDVFGGHILFKWQKDLGNDSDFILQTYYDRTERDHFYIKDKRDTIDIDFQHRLQAIWQQEIIWGIGFRYIDDQTDAGTVMSYSPAERSDHIVSAFLQNEISLIEDKLILTIGSKIEHNSYTGFEYQPSARLLWKAFDNHSFWGSVSRAIKLPSRMEQDVILQRTILEPDLAVIVFGNPDMKAEELLAYEIGYRFINNNFNVDLSFFYNDYDNLRSIQRLPIINNTDQADILPAVVQNELGGEAYGMEIAGSWKVNDDWQLSGGYSFIQLQLHSSAISNDRTEEGDEADTPHHQFTLRSLWQVSKDWQWDTTLRYVDRVNSSASTRKESVDAYITLDTRIAWQAYDFLEVALIGQNLFGDHREFRGSTVDTQATDVEPSIFFKASLNY